MVLGLFDEIGEMDEAFASTEGIDTINIKEEHGDLIFYCIGYSVLRNIELEVREVNRTYTLRNILRTSSKLATLSKKKLAYDKDYDREKECALLQTLFDQLFNFYDMGYYHDPVEAMERVYNKLIVRYKDGFSTEAANNRNLEAERSALEGKKSCGCMEDCLCFNPEDYSKNKYSENMDDFSPKCRCGRVECIC
jgi:cytochrome c556